jgi:hypothetical protein
MTAVLDQKPVMAPTRPDTSVARTITVRPAPRREPPFDDEQPVRHLRVVRGLDQTLPFEPWPGRLTRRLTWAAPRPTGRGELPDPTLWARRLLVGLLEARAGRRPLQQLAAHVSRPVHAGLIAEFERQNSTLGYPAVVKSVRVCEPADGVAEVSAVIQVGPRYRAIAARLEGLDGRWRCVRLQIG